MNNPVFNVSGRLVRESNYKKLRAYQFFSQRNLIGMIKLAVNMETK